LLVLTSVDAPVETDVPGKPARRPVFWPIPPVFFGTGRFGQALNFNEMLARA
jgi:hypothetical protein